MDQEQVDGIEASAITRGRVLTTVAFLLAIVAAMTLVTLVLVGLEYDFDDGILDPFDPAWAPLLVLGAAISAPIVLLSMKPWTRWPVGAGFALGSAWLLLKEGPLSFLMRRRSCEKASSSSIFLGAPATRGSS